MPTASCIYRGRVRHRRFTPVEHAFSYPTFMMYLDLDELDRVFERRWLWSTRRPSLAWFRRADYLGDPRIPLDRAVRDRVEDATGRRPGGPVRMLAHLRYFGYCFNPLTLYYCFAPGGSEVEAVVGEVHNTPWGERHAYVLDAAGDPSPRGPFVTPKKLHVSPFMGMDMDYRWALNRPDRQLTVHIENVRLGQRMFDATLTLERRDIGAGSLAAVLARYPWMTGQVVAAIYFQALRLWIKGAPRHPHPRHAAPPLAEKEP